LNVDHIPCGEFANESERIAVERLKAELTRLAGVGRWILLSNVPHAVTTEAIPDEVDLIAIGPPGLEIIEIKHWDRHYTKSFNDTVTHEADKLCNKVRRIASKLKAAGIDAGFLQGKFLLTKDDESRPSHRSKVHGCEFFCLKDWKELLGIGRLQTLSDLEVLRTCQLLQPLSRIALQGEVRRIASARNLELISDRQDRFHRVFRGEHARTRDKIILHLYDLSASDDPHADRIASRQCETLQKLQKSAFVPRLMDSFQEVSHYPGELFAEWHDDPEGDPEFQEVSHYPGELFYFSIVDPSAPSISQRASDPHWSTRERIEFASRALSALKELHAVDLRNVPFVHRCITPETLLVAANNHPVFTGFDLARVSGTITLSPQAILSSAAGAFAAPEIAAQGLAAADQRSDIFSVCKALGELFKNAADDKSKACALLLETGVRELPADRPTLDDLIRQLEAESDDSRINAPKVSEPASLAARFWSEGDVVLFDEGQFRVVSRIGSGSFGSTFKVIQVQDSQDVGIYAGKVMFDPESGARAIRAYRRVRSHSNQPHLATVFHFAKQWEEERFVALMQWVEGHPLQSWIGYAELYSEELGEAAAGVVGRWITSCCAGLSSLHRAGLVHGDVSPKNILEHAGDVTLVDYDLVLQEGEPIWSHGTVLYAPAEHLVGQPANCSDDLFALAATIYHVVFDREPFWYAGQRLRERGLNWEGIDRESWSWIPEFLDKATAPDRNARLTNAVEALVWIEQCQQGSSRSKGNQGADGDAEHDRVAVSKTDGTAAPSTPQRVEWLADLLSTYPGSPHGCIETRGLDSPFAHQTYVETSLEYKLLDEIKQRQVQLVILCGNAGDGKTAFLQHLANNLGIDAHTSSERVVSGSAFGLAIKINLDGAAAYRGRTADELLNELFDPFQHGASEHPCVHLVAVNDGRLLQWAETYQATNGETALTDWIIGTLVDDQPRQSMPHIRLIDLNERSLVGDARELPTTDEARTSWQPSTEFFNALLDRMLGGERETEIWQPCATCSAASRCTARNSVLTLTGRDDASREVAANVRRKLAEAFQAVHQRGQVHVTTRELRGALSYIFFGIHYCDDLHHNPDLQPMGYWDRAFAADSPMRQGELLAELQRLDPAFGANPAVDRYLRSGDSVVDPTQPPKYPQQKSLISKRRRAYFEWLDQPGRAIAGREDAIPLFQSRHAERFRRIPTLTDAEKRELIAKLCRGISRLEQLPGAVLRRTGVVPLKIMPRTPVETTFWVEKPLDRFQLDLDRTGSHSGVEWLASGLLLSYSYQSRHGHREELRLGSDLFGVLLDLAEGYQIMDAANDEVFTNVSIFIQRLAQEDEREMFAWNPSQPETIFQISVQRSGGIQQITLQPAVTSNCLEESRHA